ncbi:MAG: flagellar hook-length control protein FliK, partial [Gammaproteobacteria bacterium]|nr:flagellar hook-length control protein FliK [Gammaproteobacteria bacterium]
MMEASPTPRVQALTTQPTRASQQNTVQQADGGDNFEQQLSNQLEQANSASGSENSDSNQLVEDAVAGDDTDLPVTLEDAEVLLVEDSDLLLMVDGVEIDATDTGPQLLPGIVEISDEVHSVASPIDQIVPIAGNQLPPVESQLSAIEPPIAMQNSSITVVATTTASNTSVAAQVLDSSRASQAQTLVNNQMVEGEMAEDGDGFQDLEIVTANSGKQEANQQSRQGISIASSVAAAASQLQQVPLTTASANLNLTSANIPFDSVLSSGVSSATTSISSSIQSQAWSQGLTDQVSWMMRGNIQSAAIRLNPAHLGPLEVKLSIEDDVARLSFVSSHAPVREALDAAMPRLREMLEQQGINLADVDISQHSEQGQQSADEADNGPGVLAN